MTEKTRRLVLSACVLALLVLVLLSVLAAPRLYAAVAGRRLPTLEIQAFERPEISPAGVVALGPDPPFPLPLNAASAESLALIPGLDEGEARLVVSARELLGGFESMEQLAWVLDRDGESFEQLAAYLTLGSYAAAGGLPDALDAEAEVDRLMSLVAAQLARTDLEDPDSLDELVRLMRLCRERLVELMGESGLAARSDYDELLELLALRLDWLTGVAS